MAKKEIKFSVELDEQNQPVSIEWEASDSEFEGRKPCTSMMIHLWDKEARNSLNIDLWTREMLVQHMMVHFFHNFLNMAETFRRATGNIELADMIRQFAHQFAAKAKQSRTS